MNLEMIVGPKLFLNLNECVLLKSTRACHIINFALCSISREKCLKICTQLRPQQKKIVKIMYFYQRNKNGGLTAYVWNICLSNRYTFFFEYKLSD